MKKYLLTTIVATCLFTQGVQAELPRWYPDVFAYVGVVDRISDKAIMIRDRQFRLSPTIQVATATSPEANINNVGVGEMVGVNFITINHRRLIDRIWIIPENEQAQYR